MSVSICLQGEAPITLCSEREFRDFRIWIKRFGVSEICKFPLTYGEEEHRMIFDNTASSSNAPRHGNIRVLLQELLDVAKATVNTLTVPPLYDFILYVILEKAAEGVRENKPLLVL